MSLFKKRVYLDSASATPVSSKVMRAFLKSSRNFGNPSSPHTEGRKGARLLTEARLSIAREMEAKPDDIIFTSGATEANNIAIQGVAIATHGRKTPSHILYLPSAHSSITEPIKALEVWGFTTEPLTITDWQIDLEKLRTKIRPETVLVSMERICGETGTIWDTRAVRHVLDDARKPGEEKILLHVDASHSPRVESIERMRLGGDLITLDAQKVGGVRGAGVLFAPQNLSLSPVMHGGGQERGLRAGTENVSAIVAFAEALQEAKELRAPFTAHASKLRNELVQYFAKVQNVHENRGKEYAPHVLNLSLIGRDTDYLVALLDKNGFAVSTRSACETDSLEGSRAVFALTQDKVRAESTLRISFDSHITSRDVARFAQALKAQIAFLDANKL